MKKFIIPLCNKEIVDSKSNNFFTRKKYLLKVRMSIALVTIALTLISQNATCHTIVSYSQTFASGHSCNAGSPQKQVWFSAQLTLNSYAFVSSKATNDYVGVTASNALPVAGLTITSFTPSSGCANTTPVLITGSGLTGATSVKFGGTPAASFTVNSDTQITAIPAAGATGTISVTTPLGTGTSVASFTVNPLTTSGSITTSICGGQSYTWPANGQTYTTAQSGVTVVSGCNTATLNLSITPNKTITLTSAAATTNQTVFITSAISPITYTTTRATGATFTNLPPGVTGVWSGGVVIITGTTSSIGTFNYTVTLLGGCGTITATGTITVNGLSNWYLDVDGDHYYSGGVVVSANSPGAGYTTIGLLGGGDCDDNNVALNPGATEICYNNIDDNCNSLKSEGCAPVVVDMTPSYDGITLASLSIAIAAVPYTYPGTTNIKYRFSIANITTGQTSADIVQTSRFVNIPGTLYSSPGVYTITASAVINEEVVPYAGNTIIVNAPLIPKITLASGSCGVTLAALTSTLTANAGQNATGYIFRIRNTGGSTYATSTSGSRFVSANTFAGFPLSYNSSYQVSVQYTYNDPVTSASIVSGYGPECTVTTSDIPPTLLASPSCGSTVAALNANISAITASYATSYQFRIRLTSNVGGPYTEAAPTGSRFSSLTGFGTLQYNSSYSISVRYSVVNNGVTTFSAYGPECIIYTPNLPTTQLVPSQCGQLAATTLTQQLNIVSYPGFPNYRVRLTEYNGEDILTQQEIVVSYAYFKLNQFSTAQLGKNYNVDVAVKTGGIFGPYSTVCDIHTPAPARTIKMPFTVVAYPNPFANNLMLDVKTTSQSTVSLKVYDMIGRLIEQREVRVSDLETTTIGNKYPSGIYNVIVSQEESVETVKVIKR